MVFLIILIVLILLYVFLLIPPPSPRRDMSALTKVDYAHRGLWNAQRPENSLSAFRSAGAAGDGVWAGHARTSASVLCAIRRSTPHTRFKLSS